jgi:hypothetical protein
MAEIFQVQGKDAVVKIGPYSAINAIQNFNWDPRMNEQYLSELGNQNYSAQTIMPDISGSFELTATGSTVALLRSMITTEAASEFNGFMRGDPAGVTANTGTIRVADLENAVFDVIEAKKTDETFDRSTLIPRAHLSQISMRADANGNASETYSFEADLVRIFPTAKRDLVAVPCTRVAASPTDMSILYTAWDDVATSGTLTAWLIAFAMIDEVIVPTSNITVSAPGLFAFTGGVTASIGQRVMLYVYKRVPGTFPTISYPTSARFVKGNQVDIWVVNPATVDVAALSDGALMTQTFADSDKFLRAQSFDMNIDLRREALHQISKTTTGNSVYYRGATYPLNVTSSVNVLETTMADHAKLQGLNELTDILDVNSFEGHRWQIVARYYYNGTAIQTTALTDARVNGSGRRVSAGGRAEISWAFTGSNVIVEGLTI